MFLAAFLAVGFMQAIVFAQVGSVPDMPIPRVGMCSARIDSRLYLIGGAQTLQGMGLQGIRGTSTVEAFDFETMSWDTTIAPLETPRAFACAAALDDSIYVMGGVDSLGNVVNSTEVYDPSTNSWHYTGSMEFARKGAAAIAFGDYVLVFGGGDSLNVLHKEVEAYSPDNGAWKVLQDSTLIGRAFQQVAKVGESIFIFGGIAATIGPVSIIERYVPGVGVTGIRLAWDHPRAFFGIVTREDSVFVISGQGSATDYSNGNSSEVDVFNFGGSDTGATENIMSPTLQYPRLGFIAAFGNDNRIFLFGGISPGSNGYKNGQVAIPFVTVLSSSVTAAVVNANSSRATTGFDLEQNYPNPFNPTTTIHFAVPPPGNNVALDVFNMLGEKVKTLASGYFRPGSYAVSFNGANLPSGAYIYRLQTENGSIYRKMVLIK